MSGERIDVLAVWDAMDAEILYMQLNDSGLTDQQITEARAAVAELIEAVRDMRATKPTYSIAYGQAEQRVDAALARVQGGA